jgi:hypothetical protein
MLLGDEASLAGYSLYLIPPKRSHTTAVWSRFSQADNVRMFRQIYGRDCESQQHLEKTILTRGSDGTNQSATYTIVDKPSSQPIGWAFLQSTSTASGTFYAALFLPTLQREEIAADVSQVLCSAAFDKLGSAGLRCRTGWLDEVSLKALDNNGMSVIGTVSRRIYVAEDNRESDLYVMPRVEWPAVKNALGAYLGLLHGTGR